MPSLKVFFLSLRTYRVQSALWLAFAALLALNFVAYRQAYGMTHFRYGGSKTRKPELLSFFDKVRVLLMGVTIPKPMNLYTPEDVGLPFQVHRFRSYSDVELEAWYIPQASSQGVVLMFHGYAGCKSNLVDESQEFHRLGYEVFLVDFRGSGGSGGSQTSIGFYEGIDVARAVRYCQWHFGNRPVILYGQSMGSSAILRAVHSEGMRPTAIIVECPFDSMLNTVKNRFYSMGVPPFPSAHLLVFWGGLQQGFNAFSHNPAEYARAVHCPMLLMHGALDARVSLGEMQTIFNNLSGKKRFELFRNVGHGAYLARDPMKWRNSVATFLQECTTTP